MSDALATRPSKRQRISYGEGEDDDAASTPADNTQHDDISDMTEAEPAHMSSNRRRTCGWADLPGELRNQIYELCLTTSTLSIAVRSVKVKGKKNILKWTDMRRQSEPQWGWPGQPELPRQKKPRPTFNLLLINKATYAEGNTYLYSNDFYFFTSKELSIFLRKLSPAQKLMLQKVVLELPPPTQALRMGCGFGMGEQSNFLLSGLKGLEGAMNLKTLQLVLVETPRSVWNPPSLPVWSPEWLAAEVHKKARRWLEAISAQKGNKERAVGLINVKAFSRSERLSDKDWLSLYEEHVGSKSEDASILRRELVKRMR